MTVLLHIVTQENLELARGVIKIQAAQPGCELQVVELWEGEPDYPGLVQKIFAADSVQVW